MADIRIKDLTTPASSTASDDFIAVDGTTNGTRKLNAFSPTFGGNVVVTGTLTSNSTLSTAVGLSCQNADITGGYITLRGFGTQDGGLIFLGQSANNNYINSSASAISTAIANTAVVRAQAEGWRVLTTTASTTTSTGALVVGNGTSGGLGVGGAIFAGGAITTGNDVLDVAIYVPGNTAIRTKDGSSTKLYIDTKTVDGGDIVLRPRAATALTLAAGTGNVSIAATTASTSTSSGALVVSGGVGVAGAINAGGTLRVVGSSQIIRVRHDAATIDFTNTAQDAYVAATVIGNTLQLHGNNGTGLTIGTTGNATFAGNITTAAPAGGTAAAWKLGTVATVSPTSPNRTIEVDIGGTIYYIAAKTTNN